MISSTGDQRDLHHPQYPNLRITFISGTLGPLLLFCQHHTSTVKPGIGLSRPLSSHFAIGEAIWLVVIAVLCIICQGEGRSCQWQAGNCIAIEQTVSLSIHFLVARKIRWFLACSTFKVIHKRHFSILVGYCCRWQPSWRTCVKAC